MVDLERSIDSRGRKVWSSDYHLDLKWTWPPKSLKSLVRIRFFETSYTEDTKKNGPRNSTIVQGLLVANWRPSNDMNDGKAAFPEFHNVYIDPSSYKAYKKTGKFAEGTVILKELVSVGAKSTESGNGYFQGEFVSLEASVKDTVRFKDQPGGWAFFRFGEAPNYKNTGVKMKTSDCNSCHSSAPEDYVFTNTYPVLRYAKAKLIGK